MPNTLTPTQATTIGPEGSIFLDDIEPQLSSHQRDALRRCGACLLQRASSPLSGTRMCAAEADRQPEAPRPVAMAFLMARLCCRMAQDTGGVPAYHGIHP